jgi:hypothetical protein
MILFRSNPSRPKQEQAQAPDGGGATLSPSPGRFRDRPTFRDRRLQRLAAHLPQRVRTTIHWLRRPSARWIRLPSGVLFLIGGSILTPLPVFGFWMLPVGLALLAEDVPVARQLMVRILDKVEQYRPDWLRRKR